MSIYNDPSEDILTPDKPDNQPKPIIIPDTINRKALIIFVLVIALLIFVFMS